MGNTIGFSNLRVPARFCRRVAETGTVIETMARHGLERGGNRLDIFLMGEIPNNVIAIDGFAPRFDGFSIGANGASLRRTMSVVCEAERAAARILAAAQ